MAAGSVHHISTCMIHHTRSIGEAERRCHLNPYDLRCLSINYGQKGLLFRKPPLQTDGGGQQEEGKQEEALVITLLKSSLAATLGYFYPLCGRLVTTEHLGEGTTTIFIDCNNEGAGFIHAEASGVTISDLLAPPFTPRIVRSFFPLNGAVNHDGHSLPLLAVQVTELEDGYFIGCALNHCAVDGTSFWHFLNSWSAVARCGGDAAKGISLAPVVDRWFPENLRPPLRLPLPSKQEHFIERPVLSPELEETVFYFPRHAIAALKAQANAEVGEGSVTISSLQALLAYVWKAATRARNLQPEQTTIYDVVIGLRQRLQPPPPPGYLGILMRLVSATATAGELLGLPLRQVALLLNRAISTQTDAEARSWAESWVKDPFIVHLDGGLRPGHLFTGSSPRFDVYGNDFGWGKPVAVRTGVGNKLDGTLNANPGPTEGSMQMEMCFPPEVLLALMADEEFMEMASVGSSELKVAAK